MKSTTPHKHVKSFDQYVAEDYNPVLRSDPEIQMRIDPEYEKIGIIGDVGEDITDREFEENPYLDPYETEDGEFEQVPPFNLKIFKAHCEC